MERQIDNDISAFLKKNYVIYCPRLPACGPKISFLLVEGVRSYRFKL
jgi:hypothetical protein